MKPRYGARYVPCGGLGMALLGGAGGSAVVALQLMGLLQHSAYSSSMAKPPRPSDHVLVSWKAGECVGQLTVFNGQLQRHTHCFRQIFFSRPGAVWDHSSRLSSHGPGYNMVDLLLRPL